MTRLISERFFVITKESVALTSTPNKARSVILITRGGALGGADFSERGDLLAWLGESSGAKATRRLGAGRNRSLMVVAPQGRYAAPRLVAVQGPPCVTGRGNQPTKTASFSK